MAKAKSHIPDGFHTVTPHLTVKECAKAIEFYKKAFGAEEVSRHATPDGGKLMHAEIRIGGSPVMLHDEFPDWGALSPAAIGGTAVTINLYVKDADAVFATATKAGAEVTMPIQDMFWGDRYGTVKDPSGHVWAIATRKEDLTEAEMAERAKKAFS